MSILAESQPFVHHGLEETRAKPPGDHIHVVWTWSNNQHFYKALFHGNLAHIINVLYPMVFTEINLESQEAAT
jgi:hypothetical protein